MINTKKTIFTILTANQPAMDSPLIAELNAKAVEMQDQGLYDGNGVKTTSKDDQGRDITIVVREFPTQAAADEWVTFASAKNTEYNVSYISFVIQDI